MRWLSAPLTRAICPQHWTALDMTRTTLRVLAFATFVALGASASAQPQPGAAPTAEDYRAKAAEARAAAAHHREDRRDKADSSPEVPARSVL